jgi:hypothetical protein
LIFKIEAFEKDLIKLTGRCKKNLFDKVKLSTARDFRFLADKIPAQEGGQGNIQN